jgi:hypothetical protein
MRGCLPPGQGWSIEMARVLQCRFCRLELEAVPIAGGHAAVICLDCDLIGLAHEAEQGAALQAAEQPRKRRAEAATTAALRSRNLRI